MLTNLLVHKGHTKPDKDLIYMKPLDDALRRVLDWYWEPHKEILDVTAGERRIWNPVTLENESIDTKEKLWKVTFTDQSIDAKVDLVADFRRLPFKDNSFDIIVLDVPFMRPEHGIEQFGIKTHKTPDRPYYFRQHNNKWIPPEAFFFQTFKEFNRVSRNGLIIKISERYEKGYEVPVTTYMDLAYDRTFNHKSKFRRCVQIGYRGKRAGMGAKMIHPQRVLTYYVVYKKCFRCR